MTTTQLDLNGYADDDEVPGFSATAGELRRLPFVDQLTQPGAAGASARLLAERWHRANPEAAMDPRLKSGSPQDHRDREVRATLVAAGLQPHAPVDLVAKFIRLSPEGSSAAEIAAQALATRPQWFQPKTSSASAVLNRRAVTAP